MTHSYSTASTLPPVDATSIRTGMRQGDPDPHAIDGSCWMVLDDNLGVGKQIVLQLLGIQKAVVHVLPGRRYKRVRRNQYAIVPAAMEDYRALGRSVLKKEQAPSRIIDLWPLRRGDPSQPLDEIFLGLLYLLRELDKYHAPNIEIAVVSNTTHSIGGSFPTVVEHLRRSIAAEFSQVVLRNINVNFLGRSPEQIAVEILANLGSTRVSYPDNKRPIGKIHISHEDQPARNQAEVTDGQLSVVPNELESALVVWWRELLSIDNVTLDEDFFDLGGDSITAARLFKKIEKRYNIEIGLSAIFEARTILRLANLIRQEIAKAPSALRSGRSIVALQPIRTRTPIYVISGLGGNVIKFYPLRPSPR